jgi:hypothetical protein
LPSRTLQCNHESAALGRFEADSQVSAQRLTAYNRYRVVKSSIREAEMTVQTLPDSLELRLEEINRSADFALENIKRFQNGQVIPLWEKYIDGRICLQVDVSSRPNASEYFARATFEASGLADCECVGSYLSPANSCQFSMLVWIRDVSEKCRPIHSTVRLELLKFREVRDGQSLQANLCPVVESPFRLLGVGFEIFDDELRSILDNTGIMEGKFIGEVVECYPEMMNDCANARGNWQRRFWQGEISHARDLHRVKSLCEKSRVIIGERVALVRFDESADQILKLAKVSVGPIYMG